MRPRSPKPAVFKCSSKELYSYKGERAFASADVAQFGKTKKKCCRKFEKKGKKACKTCPLKCGAYEFPIA